MNIKSYVHYRDIFLSLNNHLTNIIDSGSKESIDNIIQSLMSVGIQILLPNCYSKNSYFNGLLSKELFIHSKYLINKCIYKFTLNIVFKKNIYIK